MQFEKFSLTSFDEVIRFEALLRAHATERSEFALEYFALDQAYLYSRGRPDGGRIFAAVLDVRLNLQSVHRDILAMGGVWNRSFSKSKNEGGTSLDSKERFFAKMDIHLALSSFVLRFRAMWDKLMGLVILLYAPTDYEAFVGAKSRKAKYFKLAERHGFPTFGALDIREMLTRFDDAFRTPEAHGTGVLRSYSFSMASIEQNPMSELIVFWNDTIQFVHEFHMVFEPEGKQLAATADPTTSTDLPDPV